jgi:erythromycin esterase-like protein
MTKMKRIVFSILLGFTILHYELYGQEGKNILDNLTPRLITSIDPFNEDFKDLQFLKETLKNNRIVLLGEQSHGEGATFEAKVRLIKFLHKELNYEIVSFESGLYDNYKAFERIKDSNYQDSPLKESIFRIWSDTKEFEPLLKYVHDQKNSKSPLIVTGFDCQADNIFQEEFLEDLKTISRPTLTLSEPELNILEQVISAGPEFIVSNENDSSLFFLACEKIQSNIEKLPNFENNIKARILLQSLIGWIEITKWEIDILNNVDVKVQNPRDLQMAKNLMFLAELYPDKKIIGWGASYHFANKIELFKNTEITKRYAQKLDSLEKSDEPTDLENQLAGAVPMGRVLKDKFGSSLYSISFSSFEGEFGILGTASISMQSIRPPVESIENRLADRPNEHTFIDYREIGDQTYFYSSVLGNLPLFAPWKDIFDGLFFTRKSFAPSFPAIRAANLDSKVIQNPFKSTQKRQNVGTKQVIDMETKLGVSYASIYLLNTSKGVASNSEGEFIFNTPEAKRTDKIVFSSIGYRTDTLSYQEFKKANKIELMPVANQLEEVVVRSKPLRAKDIVKLAEKKISENYYQNANQQEFFYRVKQYHGDSVVFNEEAAVLVYNPIGYKSKTNSNKILKGQILQFRNTTNNEDRRNSWAGIGSLWLIYTHDLILEKDNVLHRSAYYDLALNGITLYENRKVYDISFDCKRPGSYTTGFGYPSPISASGKIFIDVNTYSVLKIETIIQRQSHKSRSRRQPDWLHDPWGHQVIQTYKEFNGKYFLNYSKQVHYGKWTNTKTNFSYNSMEIRELLSTEIITKSTESVTTSLTNIKSVPTKEAPNFWINHNFKLEDNLEESYKLFGLTKK